MRCIFCLLTDGPFNIEHPFPEAVGGDLETDNVCVKCNSTLGHTADATVTSHIMVEAKRWQLGIRSKKTGNLPNPFAKGKLADAPDVSVHVTFPAKDKPAKIYVVPSVVSTVTAPGKGTVAIRVDASDRRKLGPMLNGALKRMGSKLTVSDEELEKLIKVQHHDNTQINYAWRFDVEKYPRGLAKIVYELAVRWLGETYLSDPIAGSLRRFVQTGTPDGTFRAEPLLSKDLEERFGHWPKDMLIACMTIHESKVRLAVGVLGVIGFWIEVSQRPARYKHAEHMFLSIDPISKIRRESTLEKEFDRLDAADLVMARPG